MAITQVTDDSHSNFTHWTPESETSSTIFGICMILGIPGNTAVVVIISKRMKKKNYTLHLMLSLAVSDLICLLTMPLWINNQLNGWNLGKSACRFFVTVLYVSIVSNLLTVTLMSVQRYLQVLYPQQWAKLGRRGEKALLISLWTLSFAIAGPYSLIYDVGKKECEISALPKAKRLFILCFETLLCFIVPFCTMVIFYLCLHKKVYQKAFLKHQRLTKMVTLILVFFFILWVPYHIFNLLEIAAIIEKFSYQQKLFDFVQRHRHIVEGIASFNTCVNPYLYAFSFKSLRRKPKEPEKDNNVTKCSTELQ